MTTDPRANILIIDDETSVVAEVAATLKTAGYACHGTCEPSTAVRLATQLGPDLIISDINLGTMSGLELCSLMRRDAGLAGVPVLFLSGAQIPDVVRKAHAAGGTYYLRKPFDPQVLLDLVDRALWMPHLVTAQAGR